MILYKKISEEDKNRISVFDTDIVDYIDDKFTFLKGVVKENDDVVVAGIVRVVNEFKIGVNPKFSNFKIAQAINTLFKQANEYVMKKGSNETIVVITKGGEHYEKLLMKHFGFTHIGGTPLRLEN